MDDQLVRQITLVHDLVTAFHIPIYEQDGFEADDVIGTICQTVSSINDIQTVIVTGDRDILQLVVDEKVLVYLPTKGISEGKIYGSHDVVERLGVLPSHIIDWKGLAGDSSDHYPGVAGIGPKTAVDLIKQFGTLESLYAALEQDHENQRIKAGVKEKLLSQRELAFLCKTLATIRRDVPVTFAIDTAKLSTLTTPEAIAFFERLKMGSIVKRLKAAHVPVLQEQKKNLPEKKKDDAEQLSLV
jgi:DNA polymerase-1